MTIVQNTTDKRPDWVDELNAAGVPVAEPNPHAHCNTLSSRRCPTGEHDNARSSLVGGLRAVAEFLENHPDLSCPTFSRPQVSYLDGTDDEKRAALKRDARILGVDEIREYEHDGTWSIAASVPFGDTVTFVLHASLGAVIPTAEAVA